MGKVSQSISSDIGQEEKEEDNNERIESWVIMKSGKTSQATFLWDYGQMGEFETPDEGDVDVDY